MKRRIPQLDPPVPRRRVLSAQEIELWHSMMKDVSHEDEPVEETKPALKLADIKPAKTRRKPPAIPQEMDADARKQIRKGKSAIEAKLDLHGFTVEVAYALLVRFVTRMQAGDVRVVLVITGKGRAPQSGILRAQLPRWLELPPLKDQVMSFSTAEKPHGGEGAWYIRLRKIKKAKP